MCFGTSSGTLSQLAHYGPIGAIFLILWITISAFQCLIQWFPPDLSQPLSIINFLIFWIWPVVIFYNYFRAIFIGPGFVPEGWRPAKKEDEKYLQYCDICDSFKAPRAHHCKKCGRCVMKLDHHCPWINTCTGHFNHANFCYFLFYAILGCTHALLMLCPCIYRALFVQLYVHTRVKNVPLIFFSFAGLISCILSIGLALGVILAVGFLLCVQLRSIIRNETGIENYIVRKAQDRDYRRNSPFVFPYNLGVKENLRQVFNWRESFNVIGDGFSWPVRDGCDQYTLTREQIEQKREKRQRTIPYDVVQRYSGAFFTFRHGLKTCICIPCTDETRIAVEAGDQVLVTRWERFWLYGERLIKSSTNDQDQTEKNRQRTRKRPRGWFPRVCVEESFRIEDVWSGKIDPESEIVREQFAKFAAAGFDQEDEHHHEHEDEHRHEQEENAPESPSTAATPPPSKRSKGVRQRKKNTPNESNS